MARRISTELVQQVEKLVKANYEAEAFFWEEDACCPQMNDEQLARAVTKSDDIWGRISDAEKATGMSSRETSRIINRMRDRREKETQEEVAHRICSVIHSRTIIKK